MRVRALARSTLCLVMAASLAGCGMPVVDTVLNPDLRQLVITVENQSARPVRIVVAEDEMPMGAVVGTVSPDPVPPGVTVDVRFGIPGDGSWGIFVNPGPEIGPLITSHDIPPQAPGKLPVTIMVLPDGTPVSSAPDLPGWFGN